MNNLEAAMAMGQVQPGDVLLFKNGERGILNGAIRAVQKRALLDLDKTLTPQQAAGASVYTHAAQVVFPGVIAEQYAPKARYRNAAEIPAGSMIMVKRLRDSSPEQLAPVIKHWHAVVERKEPYPRRELLYYYCRWASKLAFTRKFADVFKDTKHNVCSGEVVNASKAGGWFAGEPPEAWYPARLALDWSQFWFITFVTV